MAASKEIDAIVIATPPYYHPDHLTAVVASGKHVYLEKPVAVDVALSAGVSSRSTSKISNAKKAVIPGSTSATSTGRQCERPSQKLATPVASSQNSNQATKHTSATSAVASTVFSSTAHNHMRLLLRRSCPWSCRWIQDCTGCISGCAPRTRGGHAR
ncbi:MAG: hypothetical protein DMG34_02670 [Acidobacteria bacterium]|nr:MAG: hypothetical protein DMG34_02670 [Acidobacteriota bacterium]